MTLKKAPTSSTLLKTKLKIPPKLDSQISKQKISRRMWHKNNRKSPSILNLTKMSQKCQKKHRKKRLRNNFKFCTMVILNSEKYLKSQMLAHLVLRRNTKLLKPTCKAVAQQGFKLSYRRRKMKKWTRKRLKLCLKLKRKLLKNSSWLSISKILCWNKFSEVIHQHLLSIKSIKLCCNTNVLVKQVNLIKVQKMPSTRAAK